MRDVYIDPQPGDIVRVDDDRERHVAGRWSDGMVAYIHVKKNVSAGKEVTLRSWQRWCSHYRPDVIQRGDGAAP